MESLWDNAVRTDTREEDGSWTVEWYAGGRQLAMGNMTEEIYFAVYFGKTVMPLTGDL